MLPWWRSKFEYRKNRTMLLAIVVSLVLHACLWLPIIFLRNETQKSSHEKLVVELFGMIADIQREQHTFAPAEKTPPPPVQPKITPRHSHPAAREPVKERVTTLQDSPVQVSEQKKTDDVSQSRQSVQTDDGSANDRREQKTLDVQDKNIDALKQFLGKLQKKANANVVYSEEAQKSGHEGTVLVKFSVTENGAIRPGSLVLSRSSSYADLDASALKAIQAAAPFDPPPREITVTIGLSFPQKK